MLQQEAPDDFCIATGVQYSVRQFLEVACCELGLEVRWEGKGVDEKGVEVTTGKVIVAVDPRLLPSGRGGDPAGRRLQGKGGTGVDAENQFSGFGARNGNRWSAERRERPTMPTGGV
jgi:hypothetical protein